MAPTLRHGQQVLVAPRAPQIGEVALVEHPERPGFQMLKRVARIEEGGLWVLGDSAAASTDSRHFGLVRDAAGTVTCTLTA
jgi:nickel-type superoxide dismutase maturation protease